MDGIQNNGISMADLQSKIAQMNEVRKDMQVSATRDSSNNIVITVTTAGKTYTVPNAVSLPVLDRPKNESCAEELDKVIAAIEKFCKDLEAQAAAKNGSTSASSSAAASMTNVYFDLYAAIALLKETAQEERKRASETRQRQHEQLATSIRDEAKTIENNASSAYSNAMALQIANTVVSAGALCATCGCAYAQRSAVKNSPAQATQNKIDSMNTASSEMSAAHKTAVAEFNAQQNSQPQRVGNEAFGEGIEMRNMNVDQQPVEQNPVQQEVQKENCPDTMLKSKAAAINTEAKKTELASAKLELEEAQHAYTEELSKAEPDPQKVLEAEEKVNAKSEAVKKAEAKYAEAMSKEAAAMREEIPKLAGNDAATETAKKYQQQRLCEMNSDMRSCLDSGIAELKETYNEQLSGVLNSRSYHKAQNWMTGINQGIQSINAGMQMLQSAQDKANAEQRASEKRVEADQESIRMNLEVTKEDLQRARDVLNDCNQLLKAISESERQVSQAIANRI